MTQVTGGIASVYHAFFAHMDAHQVENAWKNELYFLMVMQCRSLEPYDIV